MVSARTDEEEMARADDGKFFGSGRTKQKYDL
jgi:hypothetical protein